MLLRLVGHHTRSDTHEGIQNRAAMVKLLTEPFTDTRKIYGYGRHRLAGDARVSLAMRHRGPRASRGANALG